MRSVGHHVIIKRPRSRTEPLVSLHGPFMDFMARDPHLGKVGLPTSGSAEVRLPAIHRDPLDTTRLGGGLLAAGTAMSEPSLCA
jgi:hypothetical protein